MSYQLTDNSLPPDAFPWLALLQWLMFGASITCFILGAAL